MDCPQGRRVSTGGRMGHLCALGGVKGHSLLLIKTPLIYEKLAQKKGVTKVYETWGLRLLR